VWLSSRGQAPQRAWETVSPWDLSLVTGGQEMVRRAERGVGLAIRKSQASGDVVPPGSNGGPQADYERNGQTVRVTHPVRNENRMSPSEVFANGTDCVQTYAVTDVSDARFDEALTEAKDEGNLSRASAAALSLRGVRLVP